MEQQYYLTVNELADRLRLPRSWIYSRTRETGPGSMPRIRVGKYLRFEWGKIEEWLNENDSGRKSNGI